jgi:Domain of unknown function (DUF4180)
VSNDVPTNSVVLTSNDKKFLECTPGVLLVNDAFAINSILEICFRHHVNRVLLYSDNVAKEFFDLSTGMAGEILQKCRNYGMRIAMVLDPNLKMSSKFRELVSEENDRTDFRFFNERDIAQHWLIQH